MGEMRLGTSGWSYDEWIGPFYESKKTPKLTHYQQIFPTAEIDSTFYAYPSERTVYGWLRHTGPDFIFSAKLPGLITHDKALKGVEDDLQRFLDLMQPLSLNGKLLAILIQLPPSQAFDPDLLEAFFKILPKQPRFAIEFRNKTWLNPETWKLLARYGVANTIVDEPLLPPEPIVTTDLAYIRWHGKGRNIWYNYRYTPDELKPWVPRVRKASAQTKSLVGYFNNHFHGYAVENCVQVLEMLGIATPRQVEVGEKARQHIEGQTRTPRPEGTLSSYLGTKHQENEESVEHLLLSARLTDAGRLKRAREMPDQELKIVEDQPSQIKAEIHGYTITIDLRDRTITHDCADWKKTIEEKKLCKHVDKLLLTLPQNHAKLIITDLRSNMSLWLYQSYALPGNAGVLTNKDTSPNQI
jgi:uncharacterized protein YecE (DUF72 family)